MEHLPAQQPISGAVSIRIYGPKGSVAAETFVDAADAPYVQQYRWTLSRHGYAIRCESKAGHRRYFLLHRELLGLKHGDEREGDHIDRNRLNNRRANLRAVSKTANRQNISGNRVAASRFRGVSWHSKLGKWRARAFIDGRNRSLGLFQVEADAAQAARLARLQGMPFAVD